MALTLTTTAEIERRAGKGRSTDISGSAITDIGEKAEGELCGYTRRDWVAYQSTMSGSALAKFVSAVVSSRAGFEWANYSRQGYFSRAEQETILDVLDENWKKGVEILSKIDAKDIREVSE